MITKIVEKKHPANNGESQKFEAFNNDSQNLKEDRNIRSKDIEVYNQQITKSNPSLPAVVEQMDGPYTSPRSSITNRRNSLIS